MDEVEAGKMAGELEWERQARQRAASASAFNRTKYDAVQPQRRRHHLFLTLASSHDRQEAIRKKTSVWLTADKESAPELIVNRLTHRATPFTVAASAPPTRLWAARRLGQSSKHHTPIGQ